MATKILLVLTGYMFEVCSIIILQADQIGFITHLLI